MLTKHILSRIVLVPSLRSLHTYIPQSIPVQLQWNRRYTTERASYIQVERDSILEDVAWVRLNRKPVNSLNKDMLMELNIALENLENNESYRGVILTSKNPGIFSAGLDIMEFYPRSPEYIREFWAEVQNMWLNMYGTRLAVIAAINGHSPAGGCLMALASDYRIMSAGKYRIGPNEVKLGIVAPSWFQEMIINTVGQRIAEQALQLGTMFSVEEAHSVGMIDKVVSQENIEEAAREEMRKWLRIPDHARVLCKQMIRKHAINGLINNRENEMDSISNYMGSGLIQKSLGHYLDRLKEKKNEK